MGALKEGKKGTVMLSGFDIVGGSLYEHMEQLRNLKEYSLPQHDATQILKASFFPITEMMMTFRK